MPNPSHNTLDCRNLNQISSHQLADLTQILYEILTRGSCYRVVETKEGSVCSTSRLELGLGLSDLVPALVGVALPLVVRVEALLS